VRRLCPMPRSHTPLLRTTSYTFLYDRPTSQVRFDTHFE
jgi:hypothetical protein